MKHTSGPWQVCVDRDEGVYIESESVDGANKTIAWIATSVGWTDASGVSHRADRPTESNARLMAHSPCMLAALIQIKQLALSCYDETFSSQEKSLKLGMIAGIAARVSAKAEGKK